MIQKKKIEDIIQILERIYPTVAPPLKHYSAYTFLIAVLLSARCTDKKVNQITPLLFERANNPEDMLLLGTERIRKIIKPCGLSPRKSKAIFDLSRILIDVYKGKVPNNFQDLEKLPGVGHKTASVIMAQWYGELAFPIDTHVHRLMFRWGLSNGKSVVQTEKDCKRVFPKKLWNKLHLQIVFFGREYCPSRNHIIENCHICKKYNTRKYPKNTL